MRHYIGMIANAHIKKGSNSYENVKTFYGNIGSEVIFEGALASIFLETQSKFHIFCIVFQKAKVAMLL